MTWGLAKVIWEFNNKEQSRWVGWTHPNWEVRIRQRDLSDFK